MVAIEFCFTAGQYHGSPWDAEANEGRVEWPPSPWKIARALAASYYERCRELDKEVVSALLPKLAAHPPSYRLPDAVHTHTRHYMPRLDKDATSKTFDAFLRIERDDPLVIAWPNLDLSEPECEALRMLVERLGFLGRAESWVAGTVVSEWEGAFNCVPTTPDSPHDGAREESLALCDPVRFSSIAAAQRGAVESRALAEAQEKALGKGKEPPEKLTGSQRKKVDALVPGTPFDALCVATDDLHRAGVSQPFGTRLVRYQRPPLTTRGTAYPPVSSRGPVTLIRWAVASNVLPRLADTVHHASRLHRSVVKWTDGEPVFAGRDGEQRATGHEHAHILVEPDERGRIGAFLLWVPAGIAAEHRDAMLGVQKLYPGKHGSEFLKLIPTHVGDAAELAIPTLGTGTVWRSVTPFVPTRFPATSGSRGNPRLDAATEVVFNGELQKLQKGSAPHDLVRLLRHRHGVTPVRVDTVEGVEFLGRETPWRKFATRRLDGGGKRGPGPGVGFEIEFEEPLTGPVVAGYGAHFGLGMFAVVR